MRLPWRRRAEQAEKAAEVARQHLEQVKAETPKYRALAQRLARVQEVNHLGATAARVLRGEGK